MNYNTVRPRYNRKNRNWFNIAGAKHCLLLAQILLCKEEGAAEKDD